jgi:hypothetical protein
MELAEKQN